MAIPITDLEQAINFWRARSPAQGEERRLCPQASALAEVYALMILQRQGEFNLAAMPQPAQAAMAVWRAEAPRAS